MSPARERLLVVLALLALGGAAVLTSTRTFSSVDLIGVQQPLLVTGAQAAPALAPIGLAQLALAGALTIAGRVARVVLGLLLVLLGAAVVALAAPVAADPSSGTRGPIAAATGVTGGEQLVGQIAGTAWPVVAVVAGVLSALLGVLVLVRARRWSTGGRRFRQPAAGPAVTTDPVSEWDALTRGGDPTDAPDREAESP